VAACADDEQAANPARTQVAIAPAERTGVPMATPPSAGGVPMAPATAPPTSYSVPSEDSTAPSVAGEDGTPGLATSPETREDLDVDAPDTSREGASPGGAPGGAGIPAQ
jgi:hypothetical protein